MIPLTIAGANGRPHRFRTEYAGTEAQQATGMMYRTHVPRGTGMIFPLTPQRVATFWMHDCPSGLDLIFIAPGGVIESIGANAPPMSDAIVASKGVVAAVFEIGPGEAARLGIHAGDKAAWKAPLAQGEAVR